MKNVFAIFLLGVAIPAAAQTDPWFSDDKYKHFAVSAAIASAVTVATEDKQVGFWASVGVGVAKEIYDSQQPGCYISVRDLAWDVLGAYVGAELTGWVLRVDGNSATVLYIKDF